MHTTASLTVDAPAEEVRQALLDYQQWPAIFPTISGVTLIERDADRWRLLIDHREGRVTNVLDVHDDGSVALLEEKRNYDAVFVNRFAPLSRTRSAYRIEATILPHGKLRLLSPVAGPFVRLQLRRLTMTPLKHAAEQRWRSTDG